MGIASDTRAGGVRIPANLVAGAEDLSPNMQAMVKGFREGWITGDDIRERYGQRAVEEDRARTAQAVVAQKAATELAPLQIEAQKQALQVQTSPIKQQIAQLGLENELAELQFKKQTQPVVDKIEKAKFAQALDETLGGLPASMIKKMSMENPGILTPEYDPNTGVVTNKDQVVKQLVNLRRIEEMRKTVDGLQDAVETKTVTLPNGQAGLQMVWKNTTSPVPPQIRQMIESYRNNTLFRVAPGEVLPPTGGAAVQPAAPAQPVSYEEMTPGQVLDSVQQGFTPETAAPSGTIIPASGLPIQVTGPGFKVPKEKDLGPLEKGMKIGTQTPEGILVTGNPKDTNRLIPSEGMNKFFQLRMAVENISDLAIAYQKIKDKSPNLIGVVRGRIVGPALGEWDEYYKVLQNSVQSTVPGMARGIFGEVGVLSDADIVNYSKLLPTAKTDPVVAEKILGDIMVKANRAVNLVLDSYEKAGYDTTGFQDMGQTSQKTVEMLQGGVSPFAVARGKRGGQAPMIKLGEGGKPDRSSIPTFKPSDVRGIQGALESGAEWIQIEGEPVPRRLRK